MSHSLSLALHTRLLLYADSKAVSAERCSLCLPATVNGTSLASHIILVILCMLCIGIAARHALEPAPTWMKASRDILCPHGDIRACRVISASSPALERPPATLPPLERE
jgi:hypothetical protein